MVYRFGGYTLDTGLRELRRGGELVSVEPKVFHLLGYLIMRRERVVSVDEILSGLWPDERVTASSLTFCVNGARRAVGDDGRRQAIIKNIRGHGYRFVAECQESRPGAAVEVVPERTAPSSGFVGRHAEMTLLDGALDAAIAGVGSSVLLSGDAGIGKTRTTEELARLARAKGVHVLTGRCYEGPESPAFWPWLQMIRADLAVWSPAQLRKLLGAGAADIARMLPAVRNFLPDVPDNPAADVIQSRFRLFDGLAGYFKSAARWQPLLVILDDLHWADRSSHTLLRFVVEELRGERVLLVGTYRDGEVDGDHPLAALGAALRREGAQHVRLPGMSPEEVDALLAQTGGHPVGGELARQLAVETEGNPLFVIEMVRQLREAHQEKRISGQPLPETVQSIIERRLQRLDPEVREVLALASVCGREFSTHLLEELARDNGDPPILRLEQARQKGIVEEVSDVPDRYRFTHALFRESLYAGLPLAKRLRAHARLSALLRQVGGESAISEVAQHALAALPSIDVDSAIGLALSAARNALEILAYEEAVQGCERALEALRRYAPDAVALRCRILLLLGESLSRLGETSASRGAFDQVAEIARGHGFKEELALAALRGSGGMVQPVILMQGQVAQLEEALALLGDGNAVLRSRLLSRLALALYYHVEGQRPRRLAMSAEATRLARKHRDEEALYWALVSRHWALWGPKAPAQRLRIADRLVRLGHKRGQRALVLRAQTYRVGALLELGRIADVDAAIADCDQLAGELRIPMFVWTAAYFRAMRTLLRGDLTEAQRLCSEAANLGSGEAGEDSAAHVFGIQVCAVALLQRRIGVLENLVLAYREQRPDMPFLECALVAMYVESGRTDAGRELLHDLAADGFRRIPQDNLWITGMTLLALAAASLRETRLAAALYGILKPYDGLLVVCGNAVATVGPVAHYLAVLARALGKNAAAERHAAAAGRMNRAIGDPQWPVSLEVAS